MIRDATIDDVPEMMTLGYRMHRESNYLSIPFHADCTARLVMNLIDSPDGFVAVSVHDEQVTGLMIGMAYPAWFGNGIDKIANDLVLYVAPERRRGATAVLLAQAFKDWALASGARQVRVGTAAGIEGQAANAIYQNLGFVETGRCFMLEARSEPHAYQSFDQHLAAH